MTQTGTTCAQVRNPQRQHVASSNVRLQARMRLCAGYMYMTRQQSSRMVHTLRSTRCLPPATACTVTMCGSSLSGVLSIIKYAMCHAAAVCRKLYDRQGMGIGLLRKLFGKADKSRGARPQKHAKAAGGLMRHMLIQLESCGLVEKSGGEKGGRQLSPAVRF